MDAPDPKEGLVDRTPRWKVGEFSLHDGEDSPFTFQPPEEWAAGDEIDPRYCPRCHMRIPASMSARQTVCNACLEAARREVPGTTTADTHIGVCPKCGSRYLVSDGWGSPALEGFKEGLIGSMWRIFGMSAAALFAVVFRPKPIDEVDVWINCRACGHCWRPDDPAATRSETMREWDDASRHMGPAAPSSDIDSEAGPARGGYSDRQDEPSPDREAEAPREEPKEPEAWTDDFEPRFCVRCHKRIPVIVSERQDACDECLQTLEMLSRGVLPGAMPPDPGQMPACPNCGGPEVEREWRTDWVSRAVDVAAEVVGFFFAHDRYGNPIDTRSEVGPAKIMGYHCLQCDERWRPRP
jgi:hypothetical protein